jgi:hypothetical protein
MITYHIRLQHCTLEEIEGFCRDLYTEMDRRGEYAIATAVADVVAVIVTGRELADATDDDGSLAADLKYDLREDDKL